MAANRDDTGLMTTLDLERFLPYRLNRLAAAVSQRFRGIYGRRYDLTIPEWRVLAVLGEIESMTATQICRHSSMHKTKVSRAVRALEERRWLCRRENRRDRREESLTLTPLGRQTYREIVPQALAFEAQVLAALGPAGSAFLTMLDRLEADQLPGAEEKETTMQADGDAIRNGSGSTDISAAG